MLSTLLGNSPTGAQPQGVGCLALAKQGRPNQKGRTQKKQASECVHKFGPSLELALACSLGQQWQQQKVTGKRPTLNAQRNTVTADGPRRKECVHVRHTGSYPGPVAVPMIIGSLMCRELETFPMVCGVSWPWEVSQFLWKRFWTFSTVLSQSVSL